MPGLRLGTNLFPHQLPALLSEELRIARQLGISAISPWNAQFEAMANAGTLKWVITVAGELRVVPYSVGRFEIAHTVASAGESVLAAGKAEVAIREAMKFGIRITTHSGHFLSGIGPDANAEAERLGRAAFARAGIIFRESDT